MSDARIQKITMPKWGLSMQEGTVVEWHVAEGTEIKPGMAVVDVKSDKIAGTVEVHVSGILRRIVAKPDVVLPVAALLGVVAPADVPDAEIDAFVTEFLANFKPEEASAEDISPKPQSVQVNNLEIRYLKRGDGDIPVILLHGFGGDKNNWLFNHEVLAKKQAVYALDFPGHGESSKQVGDGSLVMFAETLKGFMDALNIPKAHLVGHSMGGAIAMQFAVVNPARVGSLTLICSAGLGHEIAGDYIHGFVNSAGRNDLRPHVKKLFMDESLVSRQLIDDLLKYKRLDGVTPALTTIANSVFASGRQSTLLTDRVVKLGVPILVIWGNEDKIVPVAHANALGDAAKVHVISGKGHMVQMEAANEVNQLIESFLG
jgi:pyruvate dehydrogenase E2 component (dihydrolipoamide acetyltransferase)